MTEWTKEKIETLLENNDKAVGRALVRLTELQTADEVVTENTKYRNGKDFAPAMRVWALPWPSSIRSLAF
jgi:hypothetical protein